MNDPFEFRVRPVVNDLSEVERTLVWTQLGLQAGESEVNIAKYMKEDARFREKERELPQKVNGVISEMLSKVGLCCFSDRNDGQRLWTHYAGRHTGFCIEFTTAKMGFERLRKVDYGATIPRLSAMDYHDGKQDEVIAAFYVKSDEWKSESEWRAVSQKPGMPRKYPDDAISAIYFGLYATAEVIRHVYEALGDIASNVPAFKAEWEGDSFGLTFKLIPWP
jgi:hypothetical protein